MLQEIAGDRQVTIGAVGLFESASALGVAIFSRLHHHTSPHLSALVAAHKTGAVLVAAP